MLRQILSGCAVGIFLATPPAQAIDKTTLTPIDLEARICKNNPQKCGYLEGKFVYSRIAPDDPELTEVYCFLTNPWKGIPPNTVLPPERVNQFNDDSVLVKAVIAAYIYHAEIDPKSARAFDASWAATLGYLAIARARPANQTLVFDSKEKHSLSIKITDEEIWVRAR